MGFIGGRLADWLLDKSPAPEAPAAGPPEAQTPATRLDALFGGDFLETIRGKTVLDFGCGTGRESVAMAMQGAERVIGLDIQERWLERARALAQQSGVAERCHFATHTRERAAVIISKDAFEHFSDPAEVLCQMSELLDAQGCVLIAFGPTWFHPYGGHLFSVFPWAHLVFTEEALIRWRSQFKTDGATRFGEVAGGLNQMTIRRFEQVVRDSPLRTEWLEPVPIKQLRALASPWLREFGSSIVRCKLVHR